MVFSVSFFDLKKRNRGSYENPYSGVGIEFAPLAPPLSQEQILVHEVGYLERNDWWIFPNTVSPFWRLYFNSRPGHRVIFPEREIPLGPGHLVLIPDHLTFHCEGVEAVPHFWMAFSLGLSLKETGPQVIPVGDIEVGLIRRIVSNFRGPAEGDRFSIFHESSALLHLVLTRPELLWNDRPRSPAFVKAVAHIARHYAEPLDVPGLSRLAGISPRALSALFVREHHVTPTRFIAQVRVSEAAKLLATTDLSLDAIAEQTGFPNRFYFTRVFTKLGRKSPASFRKEQQVVSR